MYHDHTPTEASARTRATEAGPAFLRVPDVSVVYCPGCGMPAWVEWREDVSSTSGAVAHVKVRCFARHWFLMPEDRLTAA
ncbi:MAG: hypothetical protein ABJA74_16080 [Lapillicoccus sp.]